MAYVEVWKSGIFLTRRRVEDERAAKGCRVRLGKAGEVRLKVGESKEIGKFEVRIYTGVPEEIQQLTDQRDSDVPAGTTSVQVTPSQSQTDEKKAAKSPEAYAEESETSKPLETSAEKPAEPESLQEQVIYPKIEGYEITGRLGEGGVGTVWRAVQLSTRREVALKLLSERRFGSKKARARFEREVELAARLSHPNIAQVYDSGLHRGVYFYAMELVEGMHLDEYVLQHKLTREQILRLMQIICQAVQHAHQQGVIHRDLKPSNILVSTNGEPHIVDFGLAKTFLEEEHNLTISIEGEIAGTPAYMAPEQAAGRIDQISTATDVYGLGVILYRLLTGKWPHDFTGSRFDVLKRIVEDEVKRPREADKTIDRELQALLLKSLAKESRHRYLTVGRLEQDITNYLNREPLTAKEPTVTYFLRKRLHKHRHLIAACSLFLVLTALVISVGYVQIQNYKKRLREQMEIRNPEPGTDQTSNSASVSRPLPTPEKTEKNISVEQNQLAKTEEYFDGFVSLFNGMDLTGWFVDRGDPTAWRVEDGQIVIDENQRPGFNIDGWLLTVKDFSDFVLRLEFQFTSGADSGIALRATPGEQFQPEIQLVDDPHPRYQNNLPQERTGALYPFIIDRSVALRPADAWNQMEIDLQDTRLRVTVNQSEVLNTDVVEFGGKHPKYKSPLRNSGRIGLQNFYGSVRFRNIYIKDLSISDPVNSNALVKSTEESKTAANTNAKPVLYVNTHAQGANNGTSWQNAYRDLQDALAAAQAQSEIWIAAGTYTPDRGAGIREATFQLKSNVALYGGFAGNESQRTQRDFRNNETILSGDLQHNDGQFADPIQYPDHSARQDNCYHVVTGNDTDATEILDGFTITAGNAASDANTKNGGGMFNENGSPKIINCIFTQNTAEYGAGMYNNSGSPQLTRCKFYRNKAASRGGGIFNVNSNPTLVRCQFVENQAYRNGGGIHNNDSVIKLQQCEFIRNVTVSEQSWGGGVRNLNNSNSIMINCTFNQNSSVHGGG